MEIFIRKGWKIRDVTVGQLVIIIFQLLIHIGHQPGGGRWYGGYWGFIWQWCDNLSCHGLQCHPHWEGVHRSLNRSNDLFSYCLLPFEGSRRIDLIMKHFLMPRGQFSYLMLLVIRYRLETLDFIKHLPSVL